MHYLVHEQRHKDGKSMTPTLIVMKDDEIELRRRDLIRRAGMGVDKMRKRATEYTLDQEPQAILRQIDQLDFLADD